MEAAPDFPGLRSVSDRLRQLRRLFVPMYADRISPAIRCLVLAIFRLMYSPLLFTSAPAWWPGFFAPFFRRDADYCGLPLRDSASPATTIAALITKASGRIHCPCTAVGEPRKSYWGERKFPLIIQNVHRYFLYIAIIFIALLSWDAWKGSLVRRSERAGDPVRSGRRFDHPDSESDFPGIVHVRLPFLPNI